MKAYIFTLLSLPTIIDLRVFDQFVASNQEVSVKDKEVFLPVAT